MLESIKLWEFIVAATALSFLPGPDLIYVLTLSLTEGKKSGIITGIALSTGLIFHTLLMVFGVSIIISESELAFNIIKYGGVLYILYISAMSFKEKNSIDIDKESIPKLKLFSRFRRGIIMNILNPKVAIFFLAFFPQFLKKGVENPQSSFMIMGVVFIVVSILSFTVISLLASTLSSKLLQSTFFNNNIGRIKGVAMLLIAALLIFG